MYASRDIRTETDTCVVAILDERAAVDERYFQDVLDALPEMRITSDPKEVAEFIHSVKSDGYFLEGCA